MAELEANGGGIYSTPTGVHEDFGDLKLWTCKPYDYSENLAYNSHVPVIGYYHSAEIFPENDANFALNLPDCCALQDEELHLWLAYVEAWFRRQGAHVVIAKMTYSSGFSVE